MPPKPNEFDIATFSGASRPFDRDREGFVMGEGAAILVLEEMEAARRRGAHIHAELSGYGATADASHITAPEPTGDGARRSVLRALDRAHAQTADVGYINAHGTSTQANDAAETKAIKAVFGDHAYRVPVSSSKSMLGHLIAAAGVAELVITVMALRKGVIPPTINLETPDPECDLDYTPNTAREAKVDVALSVGSGFGGFQSAMVFGKVKEAAK